MSEQDLAVMALLLGSACLLAALMARRVGNEWRDVRAIAACAAALGGVGMMLLA